MYMTIKRAYIAGPMGFSESGRDFLYAKIIPLLENYGFEVLNPWTLTDPELIASAQFLKSGLRKIKRWKSVNIRIGKNNADAIKDCGLVFAVLDGSDVDSGTASEIGFAAALEKPVIGYRSDFRQSGDNEGSTVNLQVEYFIISSGGSIISRLDDFNSAADKIFTSNL